MEQIEEKLTLSRQIACMITVGWRKGVDGEGSGEMWSVLNPGFFNSNTSIQEIAEKHVNAIGDISAPLFEKNVPIEEIAQAMKQAACQLFTVDCVDGNITADNEGIQMLKSLLPFEFKRYGADFRLVQDDENSRFFREERLTHGEWEPFHYLSEDGQSYMATILLKLYELIPEVKNYFKLNDPVEEFSKNLQQAAMKVTDEGWECLSSYIHWYLNN